MSKRGPRSPSAPLANAVGNVYIRVTYKLTVAAPSTVLRGLKQSQPVCRQVSEEGRSGHEPLRGWIKCSSCARISAWIGQRLAYRTRLDEGVATS
jgi:hypothetical protein